MSELLLGIDVGTASSKGALVEPDGTVVALATRSHGVSMPRPGWFEHDPDATWWQDIVDLCAELVPQAKGGIAAVGVSGIGPCLAACDAEDRPLCQAILYGVDTRAIAEAGELTDLFGHEEILSRCGSALSSQALGPKLLWLARNEPAVFNATERWHMVNSFAVSRLTGRWVLDHHSASQCDPFYDLARCDWNLDWIDEAGLASLPLPELAWPNNVVGEVHALGARTTGIPAGTPVVAGTIDAWAEAASAGVRRPGQMMLQYGSTVFLVLGAEIPARHDSIWTTRGLDPGRLTLAAGLATGGSLLEWWRALVDRDFVALDAEASEIAAGAEGMLLLPYFAGERTPVLDPDARGVLIGLTLRHSRGHVVRAAMEGTAFAIRHNVQAMSGERVDRVVAVGGGAASPLWLQIVSDVTGLEQLVPAVTVGASYGDALLAAEGVGLVLPESSWVRPHHSVEPNETLRETYDELFDLYGRLYGSTREIQHALAAMQTRERLESDTVSVTEEGDE